MFMLRPTLRSTLFPYTTLFRSVSTVVLLAVAPGFRVLADEANLVGVSKNLFFHRTANFAVTGKWYFENYWNIKDRKSTRLNSSHANISYAVFCLKKKKNKKNHN